MVVCAVARALHAGMAEWLCTRAETLGFRYPTAVQRRASIAFLKQKDVVIQAGLVTWC